MSDWKPAGGIESLRLRAEVLAGIRAFFRERGVLEVETPLLCPATVTDLHIDSLRVDPSQPGNAAPSWLQTSPEFAMKKLLAAGSGDIFQVCKAFRREESSPLHNPEFTLLEWYRTGIDDRQLMDEVQALVSGLAGREPPQRLSYRALFLRHLELDPHSASRETLLQVASSRIDFDPGSYDRDDLLHLLLAQVIEPEMNYDCFIFDFPVSMAALARVVPDEQGEPVARRFELFLAGMEIANGYWELTDAREQRRRFEDDLARRRAKSLEQVPVDEALLAALEAGLPDCAGVALGLDRLLMVMRGTRDIGDVLTWH